MKNCCKMAVENYKRNNTLLKLKKVARVDTTLSKEERLKLISFLSGMVI
jgi:hypothetical protein